MGQYIVGAEHPLPMRVASISRLIALFTNAETIQQASALALQVLTWHRRGGRINADSDIKR
jgi:hypothetical protein